MWSMGQHIKTFDKTATVVVGSTYPENISYLVPRTLIFLMWEIVVENMHQSESLWMKELIVLMMSDAVSKQIDEIVASCKKRLEPKTYMALLFTTTRDNLVRKSTTSNCITNAIYEST